MNKPMHNIVIVLRPDGTFHKVVTDGYGRAATKIGNGPVEEALVSHAPENVHKIMKKAMKWDCYSPVSVIQ